VQPALRPDPALAVASVDTRLGAALGAGMVEVERLLAASTTAADPFVAQAASHLVSAGGKRFRPLLVLLAAQFGDPTAPGVVPAAVVVELTHLATLYHDDVMDEAPRRRGAASANERWGNTVAILTGDYLFAKASEILADLGPEAVRLQARTFQRLCTGQIRETVGPRPGADPVAHHVDVLAEKTGSLIATSARFGALLSGAPVEVVEALTRFGERIGVAFQLADDLVDITSPADTSGKTPGTDLREGVPTLAGLFALESDLPQDARLQSLLRRPLPDDADHAEALALLRAHPGVGLARVEAHRWADAARESLAVLPDIAARAALERLCDYVVDRTA
jgi:heptaprenyl diphosphate synthase